MWAETGFPLSNYIPSMGKALWSWCVSHLEADLFWVFLFLSNLHVGSDMRESLPAKEDQLCLMWACNWETGHYTGHYMYSPVKVEYNNAYCEDQSWQFQTRMHPIHIRNWDHTEDWRGEPFIDLIAVPQRNQNPNCRLGPPSQAFQKSKPPLKELPKKLWNRLWGKKKDLVLQTPGEQGMRGVGPPKGWAPLGHCFQWGERTSIKGSPSC